MKSPNWKLGMDLRDLNKGAIAASAALASSSLGISNAFSQSFKDKNPIQIENSKPVVKIG